MNGCFLWGGEKCHSPLLGFTQNPDLKWNLYVRTIAKDAGKIICSLYSPSKKLTSSSIIRNYKTHSCPKTDNCRHILVGSAQFLLSRH